LNTNCQCIQSSSVHACSRSQIDDKLYYFSPLFLSFSLCLPPRSTFNRAMLMCVHECEYMCIFELNSLVCCYNIIYPMCQCSCFFSISTAYLVVYHPHFIVRIVQLEAKKGRKKVDYNNIFELHMSNSFSRSLSLLRSRPKKQI
jgi:hypothetical protein